MTESGDARVADGAAASRPKSQLSLVPEDIGPIAPNQFYDLHRRDIYLSGETRLAFAVLEDAVRTYVRLRDSRRRADRVEFREVARWFEARTGGVPYSFEYVCDVLLIDPASLRSRLEVLSPDVLPTKQMRSTGRRHQLHPNRYVKRRRRALQA
jgi:hypothetical protein